MNPDEFIAAFCPCCGALVNEVLIEEEDGSTVEVRRELVEYYNRQQNRGPRYKCGWCGIETDDWSHVKQCRKLGMGGSATRMARHAVRLRALVADLEAMDDQATTG